jgi:putative tryptophan/tyrosine transport system substrate-binding protein
MRRRQFISLLGGTAAVWPLLARAQQMPVIGVLAFGASEDFSGLLGGLKDAGYLEGQNLAIEYRWTGNDPDRLQELAADLVRRQVRAIVAFRSGLAVSAAKAATNTIPIVFGYGGDPVRDGYVASLNRPGRNVTGATSLTGELVGKQFGILHELLPEAAHFAILTNPKNVGQDSTVKQAKSAALAVGRTIEVLTASTNLEIDTALARLADEKRVQALIVSNDPLFVVQRARLAILAARHQIPAIYPVHEQAEAGGLMSYGPNLLDRDREVGHYVGRVLKGEKPADLPVMQTSKFALVINLATAKALGLTVPPNLLATADEVIE